MFRRLTEKINTQPFFRYQVYILHWLAWCLFYSWSRSRVLCVAHDTIAQLISIDSSASPFHPHHLIYEGIARYWLFLLRAIGFTQDAGYLIPILNSFFGAAILTLLLHFFLKRLGWSFLDAFLSVSLLGVTFSFWYYSASIEVYILSAFFIALLIGYMTTDGPLSSKKSIVIGFLLAFSMIGHIINGLLFLPIWLWIKREESESKERFRHLIRISIPVMAVLLLGYGAAIHSMDIPISQAFHWFSGVTTRGEYWNFPWHLRSYLKILIGWGHSFIGGHFMLSQTVYGWLTTHLGNLYDLKDEVYVARNLSTEMAAILFAGAIVFAVAILGLIWQARAQLKALVSENTNRILMGVLLTYSAFFFLWDSQNIDFWVPQLVIFVMLFTQLIHNRYQPKTARWILSILIILLLGINYAGSFKFLRSNKNDFFLNYVKRMNDQFSDGTMIVYQERWHRALYMERYSNKTIVSLNQVSKAVALERIQAHLKSGELVFVEVGGVYEADLLALSPITPRRIEDAELGTFWQLTP